MNSEKLLDSQQAWFYLSMNYVWKVQLQIPPSRSVSFVKVSSCVFLKKAQVNNSSHSTAQVPF